MKKNNISRIRKYLPWLILGLILLLAVFFRFYKLDSLPPGLFPDEAANGLDIFGILERQDYRVVYNTNGSREALFFYMQAVFVHFMGNTTLALRMAPALMGVVSVLVIYLATKAWFNRRTALVAAFFFAVNPWIVTIQRNGFRASLVPLFVGLVMWFGAKAYKTNKTIYYILAALAAGLGFYTYTIFYMIIPAFILGAFYMLLLRRPWLKQNWKKLLLGLAVLGLVVSPLAVISIQNSRNSTNRVSDVSFLNKDLNGGKPLQTLVTGTAKTLLQYNIAGDENNRHNFDGLPLLNMFVGLMFLLGVVVCLFNFKKPRYSLVLIVFGIISNKMIGQDYKIIFKGGKAIQLVLAGMPETAVYKTEDIDILLMPDSNIPYDETKVKNLSGHLSYLIRWFLNTPETQYKVSVQPPNPSNVRANPFIFKLSYLKVRQKSDYRKQIMVDDFKQFSDIDFKETPVSVKPYFEKSIDYTFFIFV